VIRIGTANLRVSRGAELEVEESQNGWYRVKVNGTDGWISGRLTLPLSPTVDDAELNRAIQAIEAGGRVDLRAGVYLVPRTLTPGPALALSGLGAERAGAIQRVAGLDPGLSGALAAPDHTAARDDDHRRLAQARLESLQGPGGQVGHPGAGQEPRDLLEAGWGAGGLGLGVWRHTSPGAARGNTVNP
jgi:hypothetical protein